MTRIVALCALVAGLAAVPAAQAALTACPDFDHNGHHARGIREEKIGCRFAGGIVRHVIDHGNAGYAHYSCTHSSLPKNVTEWSCSTVRNGEKYGVQFGVQPF